MAAPAMSVGFEGGKMELYDALHAAIMAMVAGVAVSSVALAAFIGFMLMFGLIALCAAIPVLGMLSMRYIVRTWSKHRNGVVTELPWIVCLCIVAADMFFFGFICMTSILAAVGTWIFMTFIARPQPS